MTLIGRINAFIFLTDHRRWLGVPQSFFVKAIFPLLAFGVWWQQWPFSNILAVILLVLWVLMVGAYRFVRFKGYVKFVENEGLVLEGDGGREMPAERKYDIRATGMYADEKGEATVLLRQAKIWRMPRGDVALMVEERPEEFVYEFILSGSLAEVKSGSMLFGAKPLPTLKITFNSTWGPKFADHDRTQIAGITPNVKAVKKIIHLSFADVDSLQIVGNALMTMIRYEQK